MLPDYVIFKPNIGISLKNVFPAADDDLLNLLQKCLTYEPLKRCNCSQVIFKIFLAFLSLEKNVVLNRHFK